MTKNAVAINKESMPMNYERHTKAQIDPPLSLEKISKVLLDPSEFAACHRDNPVLLMKGNIITCGGEKRREEIFSCIRPECLNNGDVKLITVSHFRGGEAIDKIERKFGLSSLKFIGTHSRITGFLMSSFVTYVSPDIHVKRYANILRAIKQKYPDRHFGTPDCQTTVACDPKLTKMLHDFMNTDDLVKRKEIDDN